MTTDLIEMVTSSLSPQQIENTASTVQLPTERTRAVMPGVVAAVLATLLHRASTPAGRANIMDALPAYGSPTADRTGVAERLLGRENIGPVTDVVANHAGVSRAAGGSLLAIALAAVMGFFSRLVTTRRLNAAGIGGYLASQRASIAAMAPVGLAGALGVRNINQLDVRPAPVYVREKRRSGPLLAALTALAAVLLVIGAYALMHRTSYEPPTITGVNIPAPKVTMPSMPNVDVPSPKVETKSPLDEAFSSTTSLPTKLPIGTIEFPFASATPTDESMANVDALANALKAHPGAHVRIDGHTDAIGKDDFNQTLSMQRAASVKALLQERGVDVDNVTIAGHSERHFVADNTYESGRAENRRVEATLVSR